MPRRKRPWYRPRRSRRAQRWALAVVVASLLAAGHFARQGWIAVTTYPERAVGVSDEAVELEIPSGASLTKVIELLVEHRVLRPDDASPFKLFVLHRGAASKITAGTHNVRGTMTPEALLADLTRTQKAVSVKVTIPEGRNLLQVAELLARAGLGDAAEFERIMRDRVFLDDRGIKGPTAEGYLFPDTYKFDARAKPEAIVGRLIERHRQVYADLARRNRAGTTKLREDLGWEHDEILTLASIVEKETAAVQERPLIAGVFLNRLRFARFKPKLLQTDPTIVYGCTVPADKSEACKSFEGRIRRVHLRDKDNVYNTYTHEGLPPGPISNPGRAALQAVMAPKRSRYLYFVSRNDGTHHFSSTVAEHERYVELHQRQNKVGRLAGDKSP